ncbi:Phosphoribosylformylglycinamidine cyclo-ligase [Candidatus Anstonella stagnisolia]|nr:Phosphoribosylformylglycinamidine cyclo-ligase [Candidatus Anstonella stagnisolia]
MAPKKAASYSEAGVDIKKVKGMHASLWEQISGTFSLTKGKYGEAVELFGHYGGLFKAENGRLLVIHTDGVGSKVLLAQSLNKFDTVGIDAMAMSANDILCLGARPIVAVDYFALSKNDAELVSEVTKGLVEGAKQSMCPIIGGETAILPDIIAGGSKPFDLAVTIVGEVHESKLITGAKMKVGDVLVGLSSSGLHSNGYTLARRVLPVEKWGAEMLIPTRIYVQSVLEMLQVAQVHGIAHITGGAFSKLMRIGSYSKVGFLLDSMPAPSPIFQELAKSVNNEYEMYRTFNMGIGMVLACPASEAQKLISIAKKHNIEASIIGKVTEKQDVILKKNGKEISLL